MTANPTEFRTYFDVEVGIIYGAASNGTPSSWMVFPDGTLKRINARAYPNFDDACAAHVAIWRKRRIRLGIDKPTAKADDAARSLFDQVQDEFHSENVTIECGEVGQQFGAKCLRQTGHEYGDSPVAGFHFGRITESGPGFEVVDDGVDEWEMWRESPRIIRSLH